MVSHEHGGLSEAVYQPPEFAELAQLVCASIVLTGQAQTLKGVIVDSQQPRTLCVADYDVPNGYGEGSDVRIALSAHYNEWGGLGDNMDVAEKVETIKLTLGLAERGADEDVTVELTATDFALHKDHDRDVALMRMVAKICKLSSEEPTDEDLMPLTDAHIDLYREKTQKLFEEHNRALAAQAAAKQAAAAAEAQAELEKRRKYEQPDFITPPKPDPAPLEEDPDIAANKRTTALAAETTVDAPAKQDAELADEGPAIDDALLENNGYSVERFIDDNDARELSSRQRYVMIELCLAIDNAKIRSYRRGYRRDPNTSRIITSYMVRTGLDALPVGPEARDVEIFLTPQAKKATAAKHPDWFDHDTPLPVGYPTLFWLEEVGDRVIVDTNSRTIANFPADRFRSTEDLLYLMNVVRSDVLDQLSEIFDWTPRSAERFSKAVRAMGLPKANMTDR